MKNLNNILFASLLIFVSSCNGRKFIEIPKTDSSTIKRFEDAAEIALDWPDNNEIINQVVSEPDNLHPTNGNSSPRAEIFQYCQRPLLYIDYAKGDVIPGLVKSLPEISGDGMKYTYELRDNISWDDNKKLSVDDIAFTIKAFKCPLTNDPAVKTYWENIGDLVHDPTNASRFTLVMKKKYIQNVSFLAGFSILQRTFHDPENILSAFSISQLDDTSKTITSNPDLIRWANEFNNDKYGRDVKFMNGLGMYKVTEWASGQYITLTRKKNHWSQSSSDYHEVSFPEKIIFKINKDEASQLLELRSQSIDVSTYIGMNSFLTLTEDEKFRANYNYALIPTYNYTYICFNEKPDGAKRKKLFDDKSVRHAIALLTPVDKIIKLMYKQYSGQCRRVVTNVSPLKKEFDASLNPVPMDVKEAGTNFSKAGWTDSDSDGILDKTIDGKKIKLEADLFYLSSSAEWKDMALLIAEELAKGGVKVNPQAMDIKLFLEKARSHDFDLLLGSWGGSAIPEDYTQLWHTSSWTDHGSNYPGFGNAESDALVDSLKHELDNSKRIEMSRRLQKKIYEDQPYVFLYSSFRRHIIHKRFANQMIFSERPGVLVNMLQLLSITKGITMQTDDKP